MSNQIINAKSDKITDEMQYIAQNENISTDLLKRNITDGKTVILKNNTRENSIPCAIGKDTKVKVVAKMNATGNDITNENDKIRVIQEANPDIIFDKTASNIIKETRQALLKNTKRPIGINSFYQIAKEMIKDHNNPFEISKDDILDKIEKQCQDGVDLITINAGLTKHVNEYFVKQNEIIKMSSKSGAILSSLIQETRQENPLFEYFRDIVEIAKKYDTTINLETVLFSGSICDELNKAQMLELLSIGELVKISRENDVQTTVEISGNIRIDKIPTVINTIKQITNHVPLFVSNFLSCDIANGYNHISGSIASSIAALNGANAISSVSSTENLLEPTIAQIKESITSAQVVAHSVNIALDNKEEIQKDLEFSKAKNELDIQKQANLNLDKTVYETYIKKVKFKPCKFSDIDFASKFFNIHFLK